MARTRHWSTVSLRQNFISCFERKYLCCVGALKVYMKNYFELCRLMQEINNNLIPSTANCAAGNLKFLKCYRDVSGLTRDVTSNNWLIRWCHRRRIILPATSSVPTMADNHFVHLPIISILSWDLSSTGRACNNSTSHIRIESKSATA